MQPHGSILEDVVGVFPAADAGEAAQHPVGEGMEAAAAELDNSIPDSEVAPFEPLEALRQGCRDRVVGIHAKTGDRGQEAKTGDRVSGTPEFIRFCPLDARRSP